MVLMPYGCKRFTYRTVLEQVELANIEVVGSACYKLGSLANEPEPELEFEASLVNESSSS